MKRQSPSYSTTMRLRYRDMPGALGRVTSAIGEAEGFIGAVDVVAVDQGYITRDITVSARDLDHEQQIVERVRAIEGVRVLRVSDRTFLLHLGGKIEVNAKTPVKTRDDLSMVYTPGVARICRSIAADPGAAFALTIRHNMVAVITDGSAVLGLGNIGPRAALPVMEGKAVLFKEFAGVDAFPICLDTQDPAKIVETCVHLAPTFGGINLEDISAPRCIAIEEELSGKVDIPVFHDDQHGTAIVVMAALQNALKLVQKKLENIRITICGAARPALPSPSCCSRWAPGRSCSATARGRWSGAASYANPVKQWLAEHTNPEQLRGSLSDVIVGSDVFIGVSGPDVLRVEDILKMAPSPIIFALANPDPEIDPDLAAPHAAVVATGRSDYPNQINNVLCFPGFFRGMLDVRAARVTDAMKIAAASAIAGVISPRELTADYLVPSVFDHRVAAAVAKAVSRVAMDTGIARHEHKPPFRISK